MRELPTVYLARHGETEWSRTGQHTGRADISLTSVGEVGARKLGGRLAGIPFARVFCSPLRRARQTAEIAGFRPEIDEDLLEWHYGDCEGRTLAQVHTERPGWDLFRDGAPGGESVQEVSDRADRVARRLQAMSGNVLVFAHGHILRVLAARWVRQPAAFAGALLLSTACLSILSFDHHDPDEPAIQLWNDDRHLM